MNDNLILAKRTKNDEFYTQLSDIEKELEHYPEDTFKDKVVYCPCDVGVDGLDVPKSNFVKYFEDNKERLGYKRLLHTSLQEGYDFHSDYCTNLLKEADIVVTNPPFSLFRDFFKWLMDNDKKFIIIGNQNAITYKEIFPYLRDDKIWTGSQTGCISMYYASTDTDELTKLRNTCWFTNIDLAKRHEPLILVEKYSPEKYPKYDNYDAIEIPKLNEIPCDYNGVMGVPITYLYKHNPDQFEIIGGFNGYTEPDYENGLLCGTRTEYVDKSGKVKYWTGPTVNKVTKYFRLLIKRRSS